MLTYIRTNIQYIHTHIRKNVHPHAGIACSRHTKMPLFLYAAMSIRECGAQIFLHRLHHGFYQKCFGRLFPHSMGSSCVNQREGPIRRAFRRHKLRHVAHAQRWQDQRALQLYMGVQESSSSSDTSLLREDNRTIFASVFGGRRLQTLCIPRIKRQLHESCEGVGLCACAALIRMYCRHSQLP